MAITLGLGGLYPAPEVVNAILAPQSGVTKKILDLGACYQGNRTRLTILRMRNWHLVKAKAKWGTRTLTTIPQVH